MKTLKKVLPSLNRVSATSRFLIEVENILKEYLKDCDLSSRKPTIEGLHSAIQVEIEVQEAEGNELFLEDLENYRGEIAL